ncbi:MAG: hypothetical protein ISR27_02120 [Pseudomonadales bacterium]|nr:hypothetical protein [Pseudomonadales bacterium]
MANLQKISRVNFSIACLTVAVTGFFVWWLLQPSSPDQLLEQHASEFVEIALGLAWHRELEVDSYTGPQSLDIRQEGSAPPISELQLMTAGLLTRVKENVAVLQVDRLRKLEAKIQRLDIVLKSIIGVDTLDFDGEVKSLYELETGQDLVRAALPDTANLEALDQLLPGRGTLSFRVAAFRNQLIIPADKRRAVFEAALNECRARTLAHWALPDTETLDINWTRDVSAAWHQYDGNFKSTLAVNELSIAYLPSAIDVACHEAYPGHHAQFVMHEVAGLESGIQLEDTVFLLRTPTSVIREAAANFGVGLAFPLAERIKFEREVLAPLAGISFPDEDKYTRFLVLVDTLSESITPILREYLLGELSFNTASVRLEREALVSSPSELLLFADEFGAIGVGYQIVQRRLRQKLAASDDAWQSLLLAVVDTETRL